MELRTANPGDIPTCGSVAYHAFRDIAERHNFQPDFPSVEAATEVLNEMLEAPGFQAFVAEEGGQVIGSIFVSHRSPVGGISVVTVDPKAQNRDAGRGLMRKGMEFLVDRGHSRQQLVQAAYHHRSFCLYAKLGFIGSEVLANMTGDPIRAESPGRSVRPAISDDADACNELCQKVLGFDRGVEVTQAIARGTGVVVENDGRITGYSSGVGFTGHGIGESNEDVKALIASTEAFSGPGILIPVGNSELFRWCLESGLRVVQQMILMDTAPTSPPNGGWWPSVLC